MNLRFSNWFKYSPDDAPGVGGDNTVQPITGEEPKETFELLNEEDVTEEETLDLDEKKEESEPEEEEDDELKELEEELKPPQEEDLLEITTPVRRKEILAKYPTLFKDFPYLEKAYYREQQFTETFPTIQDAKLAADKARMLDRVDSELQNGDIRTVLQAAKDDGGDSFNKIADNYLPALREVDQQAYYHVLGNVIKDTIITMVREGRALGEQGAPLQAAANVLNQFVFGSQNFVPPTTLSRQPRPEDKAREEQIQNEDRQRFYQQFEGVKNDLQTRADNVLKSTIDTHIDPNGAMTDYVKQHATVEAFQNLENLISQDVRFRSLLDRLWERAFQSGFDKVSTEKIKSAYLSKAKTLLPTVIKKARNDALKGLARSSRSDREDRPSKGPIARTGNSTSPSSGGNSKIRKASDIPKGMSTLDFLNRG